MITLHLEEKEVEALRSALINLMANQQAPTADVLIQNSQNALHFLGKINKSEAEVKEVKTIKPVK